MNSSSTLTFSDPTTNRGGVASTSGRTCSPSVSRVFRAPARIALAATCRARSSFILHSTEAHGASTVLPVEKNLYSSDTVLGRVQSQQKVGTTTCAPLDPTDWLKFVHFFRGASAYIEGHRGKTFVVVLPGEVIDDKVLLRSTLEDVSLLHGMGVRLVVILGVGVQINKNLEAMGCKPRYVGGYRVTDDHAMAAAADAAGSIRVEVEALLSKSLAVPMVRRHARTSQKIHFGPALEVVSGNFVSAKRRGIVGGVDFHSTGKVRFIQKEAIRQQLAQGHIVLLNNLGYSAAGEVLNCNVYDVATHTAVELQADKLIVMSYENVQDLGIPPWLPLGDAEELLGQNRTDAKFDATASFHDLRCPWPPTALPRVSENGGADADGFEVNLDCWPSNGLPTSLFAAAVACRNGVKRTHVIHAKEDGALLLELYSRDGLGMMISDDFYEGIRAGAAHDLGGIESLFKPLREAGLRFPNFLEAFNDHHSHFFVIEREAKVLACAVIHYVGCAPDGAECVELEAFAVHPAYRNAGRGDSLLDYVEQDVRAEGARRLYLLTTRSQDWFLQRSFEDMGPAHATQGQVPEARRQRFDPTENARLYVKHILEPDELSSSKPAGKRIGF